MKLTVRAKKVDVSVVNLKSDSRPDVLSLYAVLVRERGAAAKRKGAIDWLLLTNFPVEDVAAAHEVIDSYRARWRIEEFHRTCKQGHCNVEDAQLRSVSAMIKWATILAAVSTRIERIKYLSRNAPDTLASAELEAVEIAALRVAYKAHLRDNGSKSSAPLPDMPTMGEAAAWIAKLGGWLGEMASR